jgi:hypothetical protein
MCLCGLEEVVRYMKQAPEAGIAASMLSAQNTFWQSKKNPTALNN